RAAEGPSSSGSLQTRRGCRRSRGLVSDRPGGAASPQWVEARQPPFRLPSQSETMADPDQPPTTESDAEPAPGGREVPRMYGAEEEWFAVRLGRAALRPARAAARSGRSALTDEAERAVDAFIAGPVAEAAVRSAIRHRLVERLVTTAVDT